MIVRLKGVKRARSKGRVYYYHRKTMTRLPGEPGSAEFMAKLRELEAKGRTAAALPGTLGVLIVAYRASPEWTQLAAASREFYQDVFDYLEPIKAMPLAEITVEWLYAMRDKTHATRKWSFANRTLTVLRMILNWGKRRGMVKDNPAEFVDKVRRPRGAKLKNRPWRDDEVATVLAAAAPWLRVGIALGVYAGLRVSDVAKLPWSCYNGHAIETVTQKRGRRVWIPAHAALKAILDAAPHSAPTILAGIRGGSIKTSTLSAAFFDLVVNLAAKGAIGPGLSFHGLRHTLGTHLAEAGCDTATIAAILGQSSLSMAEHYSRHANRDQLAAAAIYRLENRVENRSLNR